MNHDKRTAREILESLQVALEILQVATDDDLELVREDLMQMDDAADGAVGGIPRDRRPLAE